MMMACSFFYTSNNFFFSFVCFHPQGKNSPGVSKKKENKKTAKFKTDKQTKGLGLYDNHQHLEIIYNNQVGWKNALYRVDCLVFSSLGRTDRKRRQLKGKLLLYIFLSANVMLL